MGVAGGCAKAHVRLSKFNYLIKMHDERQILILYGSETGTAEDVALSIGRRLRRWHWQIRVRSMDGYSLVGRRAVGFLNIGAEFHCRQVSWTNRW